MPTQTQAWVVERQGGPFVLHDLTLDDPLENEVLVEMTASGICHTDFAVAKGLLPGSVYPVILGHEGSGTVLSTGSKTSALRPGAKVVLSFAFCDTCYGCRDKGAYACTDFMRLNFGKVRMNGSSEVGTLTNGTRVHGSFFGQSSFAKHAIVKATSCVQVTDSVDLRVLCPLGCGMQTGAGAVTNIAKPAPNSSILIGGMGGVGMAALFAAVSMGVQTIVAVDTFDSRLEQAKSLGATHVINARTTPLAEEVAKITGGKGVDFVIEATGIASAAKASFLALGLGGVQVQIGDSGIGELSVQLGSFLQGLRSIVGCAEGNCTPRDFIPTLVDLYAQGKFPLDKISKYYAWTDLPLAQSEVHSGQIIKAVLDFKGTYALHEPRVHL